jgi:hypothetical protein
MICLYSGYQLTKREGTKEKVIYRDTSLMKCLTYLERYSKAKKKRYKIREGYKVAYLTISKVTFYLIRH